MNNLPCGVTDQDIDESFDGKAPEEPEDDRYEETVLEELFRRERGGGDRALR